MATDEEQKIQAPSSEISTIVRTCKNPLVISVTVAEYTPYFPSLTGPTKDCHLVAFAMSYKRGYTLIYYDDKNVLHQIGRSSDASTSTHDSSSLEKDPNFKLKWKTGEIKQFNDEILKKLSKRNEEIKQSNSNNNDSHDESKENNNETKKQVKYDGLIYFISGHGDSNRVFYDSDCNNLNLNTVFFDRFSNKNCQYFYGKPKLFIIDCCRGKKTSKKKINQQYRADQTGVNIIVNVKTSEDEKDAASHKTNNENDRNSMITTQKDGDTTQFQKEKKTPLEKDYDNLNDVDTKKHDRDDMRCIFGNPDGYKVADSTKGGYLTRSLIIQLCTNKNITDKLSFNTLKEQADALMNKLTGSVLAQVIHDENHWTYKLNLRSKRPV